MDDLELEHGFLSAPYHVMMRAFLSGRKGVQREAESVKSAVKKELDDAMRAAAAGSGSVALAPEQADALVARVVSLQKRLEAVRAADREAMDVLQGRIAHLARRTDPGFDPRSRKKRDPEIERPPKPSVAPIDVDAMDVCEPATPSPAASPIELDAQPKPVEPVTLAEGAEAAPAACALRWEKTRLDRVLVDYMLRSGMYESAERLAMSEGLETYVDAAVFAGARSVIDGLRRRDCSEALRWCGENRKRLSKLHSTLEFQLRLQEYVELVRAGRKMQAIPYAQRWLSASAGARAVAVDASSRQDEIGRFMALLAFPASTPCQPYKNMYSPRNWSALEETFKQENYKLHGLTSESTLEILLKTGLSALKTRRCGMEGTAKSKCPTCNEPYLSLSACLPTGMHVNSILVCSISGEIMDDNNPPMALPNGNVYSQRALLEMSEMNDGTIVDPKTDREYRFTELRKCFIM